MITLVIVKLLLLQVKHFLVDYLLQTEEQIRTKGTYLDLTGMSHSFYHGLFTSVVFFPFTNVSFAFMVGLLDFVIHYHIDYVKTKYGSKDITTKAFWNHMGYDQMAHQFTYVLFIAMYMNHIS